jgi:hypothetical protein
MSVCPVGSHDSPFEDQHDLGGANYARLANEGALRRQRSASFADDD